MEKEKVIVWKKKHKSSTIIARACFRNLFMRRSQAPQIYLSSSSIRARFRTLMCFPTSALYPLYFLMIDDIVWMKRGWFALLPTKGGQKKSGTPTLTGCHWTHQTPGLIDFYFHSRAVSLSCSTLISLPPHPKPKKCSHMLRLSLPCSWVGFQRNNFTVVIAEK